MRTPERLEQRSRAAYRRMHRRQRRKEDADARDVVLREREQKAHLNQRSLRPSKLVRELSELRRALGRQR